MTRMLGALTRPLRMKKCQRYGCCWEPPNGTKGGLRLREERDWGRDWFEETAPDVPEWVELTIRYAEERYSR